MNKKSLIGLVIGLIVIALIVVVAVAGLSGSEEKDSGQASKSNDTNSSSEQASDATEVTIKDYKYMEKDLKVKVGTTVRWTNEDSVPHSVTGDDIEKSGLDSENFGQGETFEYTFDKAGEFSYFCKPHPYMKGSVTVTE